MNILELNKRFPTDEAALIHLEKVRWNGNITCPFCGTNRISIMPNQMRYHCNEENRSFSVRANTIFEESRLDIRKWFYAIMLMLNAKKGISAMQLARDIDVSYKTAWYCLMRIRCAMASDFELLHGLIEMDTAKIGGKPRKDNFLSTINTGQGTKTSGKVNIIAAVERGKKGKVIAKLIPDTTTQTLLKVLNKNINNESSVLITDDAKSHKGLDEEFDRLFVTHGKQFSREGISINKVEGFFSILKRGLIGQYHKLSVKYLPFYLAEFTYRYNHSLDKTAFNKTIELAIENNKCMVRYKCKTDECVHICDI